MFISQVGGAFGLFLGCSLVSFVEVLYWAWRAARGM